MRSDNVLKNSVWGIINQIISIVLGFVGRTIFIKFLSADYLGISGLFGNILNLLSLSELGFSSAVAFHLYKPIAENNTSKIAGIMNFYKTVYRIIAVCVLVIGCSLLPFLGYIIKESDFTLQYIRIIYFISLINTVSSYLFSYKYTLAIADQKNYLLTNIDIITRFVSTVANIIVLVIMRNYLVYVLSGTAINILFNFVKAKKVTHIYTSLKRKESIDKKEKKKIFGDVKNIFAGKVSTVIVSSTDNILISAFVSLKVVGLYSNYSMLIGYVQAFLTQFTSATQASFGNLIASESKDYAYSVMKRLTIILYFVTSFCCVCLFVLLNPFINLWIGGNFLLNFDVVAWCIASFYIQIIKAPVWYSLGGVGYFKEDRNISIVGAVSNLVISVICAKIWGLSGIFMGTVFSQLIQWVLKVQLFIKRYVGGKVLEYHLLSLRLALQTVVMCAGTYWVVTAIVVDNIFLDFIIKMVICVVIPNSINLILYRKSDSFQYIMNYVKNIFKKMRRTKV